MQNTKAQQSSISKGSGLKSKKLGQRSIGGKDATSSHYSGGLNKKGGGAQGNKKIPRFLTKKEKEAKEAMDKRQKAFKEKQKRMKELEKEIEEMQELVREKIKNPDIKRRNSLTSFREMLPKEEQKMEELPSCFGDDVSFKEYHAQKEEERLGRVEWRA